jgi:hypothetical protein
MICYILIIGKHSNRKGEENEKTGRCKADGI